MRRAEPSATVAGFDHHPRGRALSIVAGSLLCILGGAAHGEPAPPPRAKAPPRSERRSPPRRAEKPPAAQPAPASITEGTFNECRKAPSGKRLVRVSVPSNTDVNHLITWLSSVTCKAFVYATDETAHGREVTLVAPVYVTPEEAFRLVFNALDAVGLTLRPSGTFFQVIESQYARVTSVPVYGYDGRRIRER
jgi:hypothetical protein